MILARRGNRPSTTTNVVCLVPDTSTTSELDTLIAATENASNRMIDVEDLDDEELERMRKRFGELATSSPRFGEDESQQREIRGPRKIS